MKIGVICGSLRYKDEMLREHDYINNYKEDMCVMLPDITSSKCKYLSDKHKKLIINHFRKIMTSDFIYVVDVGGYIGEGTLHEIALAEALGKEVIYMSELISNDSLPKQSL